MRAESGAEPLPELVIRPSRAAGSIPSLALTMLGAAAVLAFISFQQRQPMFAYIALAVVVGSLVIGAYLWLSIRNVRMLVTKDYFARSDWLGRRRRWPLTLIGRVVQGPVEIGGSDTVEGPHTVDISQEILILNVKESTLWSISPQQWRDSDLDLLWKRLGKQPMVGWTEPIRPEDLRKRFPGAAAELPRSSLSIFEYAAVIAFSLVLAIVLSICVLR